MTPEGLPAISVPLPWQAEAWSRWQVQLERRQLPHALLISGPAGIGKLRLAVALARRLLCHQPRDGYNCGECPACVHSRAGSHGDWRWIEPTGKGQVIRIDQIRELIAFAFRTAGFGQRKVMVLAPADRMNVAAANALLKCLEEPAEDTYLLLVSDRLHALPATVRSRCQRLPLGLPPAPEALEWLDPLTGQRAASEQLLALAGGRPLRAEALYRSAGSEALEARRAALSAFCAGRCSLPEVAGLFGELPLTAALEELEDQLVLHLRALSREQLPRRGRRLFAVLEQVGALRRSAAAGANPNPQLALENLLLQLQDSFRRPGAGATMKTMQPGGRA